MSRSAIAFPLAESDKTSAIESSTVKAGISDALALFNSASHQLADNYQEMEQRVDSLHEELQQAAEERLKELQEKERLSNHLESLLHILPAGVVVIDSRGKITDCNPAAVAFLGEPLIGELWRDVIAKNFSPRGDDGHEISLKDGRRVSLETRSLDVGGGQLIVLTDMTETRELQRKVHQNQRLSEMGRMMSSLAHQIRTPLSAAMLYAGHLCDSDLNRDQVRRFSEKIQSRLSHLEQQVKDMLIFVRGDVKLTDAITTLELMEDLELAMEVIIEQSGAQYQIDNQCPDVRLQCHRESMTGALLNIVNNAIQAVPANAAEMIIRLRLNASDQVEIAIIDNGPGFSKEALTHLEEPFYTTKPQGTGLGLTVVRAVVKAHHGECCLRTEKGGGVVSVHLPIIGRIQTAAGGKGL